MGKDRRSLQMRITLAHEQVNLQAALPEPA
jgi:hypothetical protein